MCVCVSPAFPWASCQRRNAGTDAIKTGCSRGRKRLQVSSGCSGGRGCEFPGRERNFSSALQLHCSEHKKAPGPVSTCWLFWFIYFFISLACSFDIEKNDECGTISWRFVPFFSVGRSVLCLMFENLRFWKECNTFLEIKFDKNDLRKVVRTA